MSCFFALLRHLQLGFSYDQLIYFEIIGPLSSGVTVPDEFIEKSWVECTRAIWFSHDAHD